jgi:hypothetical protein
MIDRFRYLRWLSTIFYVLAWLTVAWGVFALFTARIEDEHHYDAYLHIMVTDEKGIGFMGVVAILFDTGLRFLLLMGASQAIKLWLHLEQAIDGLARRLADVVVATSDIKAGITSTNANVLKVGAIVYEEAKKDD